MNAFKQYIFKVKYVLSLNNVGIQNNNTPNIYIIYFSPFNFFLDITQKFINNRTDQLL